MQDTKNCLAEAQREGGIGRREALALIGATGAALAAGCASDSPTSPTDVTGAATTTTHDHSDRRWRRHWRGLRRDAERNDRALSLV